VIVSFRRERADLSRNPHSVGAAGYRGSMTKTDHPTREEVEAQRAAILQSLGLTAAELAERAESGELVGEEWLAWAEVRELGYLLGE